MTLTPFAASTLALESRAMLTRLARMQPFALVMPMVGAATASVISRASDSATPSMTMQNAPASSVALASAMTRLRSSSVRPWP